MFKYLLSLVIIGLLSGPIVYPTTSQAGVCDSIVKLYNRLVKGEYYFSKAEIDDLDKVLKNWTPSKIDGLYNMSEQHFFYLLNDSPKEIVDLMRHAPADRKSFDAYHFELSKRLKNNDLKTLFPDLFSSYKRRIEWSKGTPEEFISKGLDNLSKLPEEQLTQIRKELRDKFENTLGFQQVLKSYYKELHVEKLNGIEVIKIGEIYYPYRADKGKHLILVPRTEMRHPAWNPIDTRNAINIAQAKVPPPENYRIAVGLDGKFYIEDGNHRFSIVEFRDEIWVHLGHDLRTLNTSGHYDYAFGGVMRTEDMKKIVKGELDPLFYFGPRRDKIVFDVDELVKPTPTKYFNPYQD